MKQSPKMQIAWITIFLAVLIVFQPELRRGLIALSQRPLWRSFFDTGTERTITPSWDPTRLDEVRVRQILEELGHPLRPE